MNIFLVWWYTAHLAHKGLIHHDSFNCAMATEDLLVSDKQRDVNEQWHSSLYKQICDVVSHVLQHCMCDVTDLSLASPAITQLCVIVLNRRMVLFHLVFPCVLPRSTSLNSSSLAKPQSQQRLLS